MADDRDIKIYVKKTMTETGEFRIINDEIQQHIANGNRDKAIALGQKMAKVRPEDGFVDLGNLNMTSALLYQIRVLLTFMAEYSIQKNIPVEFLADTASSSLYEYLKKGGDPAENIGKQFSMLCNISWQEIIDLGKRIFTQSAEYFDRMIKETTFDEV